MTPEEYRTQGHVPHLKAFLDTPAGKSLLEVLEDYGKPSSEARKQYGGAEDVKLQMSLNYVAMEQTFEIVKLVKKLVQMAPNRAPRAAAPDLVDEDASPETLKQLGITIPEPIDYRKVQQAKVEESIAS